MEHTRAVCDAGTHHGPPGARLSCSQGKASMQPHPNTDQRTRNDVCRAPSSEGGARPPWEIAVGTTHYTVHRAHFPHLPPVVIAIPAPFRDQPFHVVSSLAGAGLRLIPASVHHARISSAEAP